MMHTLGLQIGDQNAKVDLVLLYDVDDNASKTKNK